MKRLIAVLMAAMMFTGVLTACSGTVGMDDGRAYGNVSTTPDGRVNGRGYESGYNGNYGGMTGNYNNGMFGGSNSGTGMTGGR